MIDQRINSVHSVLVTVSAIFLLNISHSKEVGEKRKNL